MFQNCSVMKKVMDNKNREGLSRFSVRTFLSQSAVKNRMGDPCVSETFWCGKNMDKKGASKFSLGKVLSHSAKKFRRGALLCFGKFW